MRPNPDEAYAQLDMTSRTDVQTKITPECKKQNINYIHNHHITNDDIIKAFKQPNQSQVI